MKVTFGDKGCCTPITDFDKLFFISMEHNLHLCMGLIKQERAVVCQIWALPHMDPRVCTHSANAKGWWCVFQCGVTQGSYVFVV